MKFSIGDKVVLKRTGEEGIVAGYINKDMLEVEVQGTTFPVYMDEVDHPYLKWFTEKKVVKKAKSLPEQLPVEKQQFRKPRLARGIYLSFLPVFKTEESEDIVDYIKVHLLNETGQPIRYKYDVRFMNESEFRHEGSLHAFGDVYLHSVPYDDMNDQPRFHWQLANTETKKELISDAEGILRIRPVKLFEHINQLLHSNTPTFSYQLIEDFIPKAKPEKKEKFELSLKPDYIAGSQNTLPDSPGYELDLHIEKLIENTVNLSNSEMLQIQLDALHKALDTALLYRQQRLVVIHGVGRGILKDEVHKILADFPQIEKFINEYDGRYGFGATEIYFKY